MGTFELGSVACELGLKPLEDLLTMGTLPFDLGPPAASAMAVAAREVFDADADAVDGFGGATNDSSPQSVTSTISW